MAGVLLTSGASPEKAAAEPASVRATIERRISDLYLLPFFVLFLTYIFFRFLF